LFLPGSHIPIKSVETIQEAKPDYIIILPWNIKDEIMEQMKFVNNWGGKFVIPIPEVKIL
jgi:ABC-type Fe3+-hydroxamate transport system substrate-binding protein